MANLKISDLTAIAEATVAGTDVLPVADISASETKKVTAADIVKAGARLNTGSVPFGGPLGITAGTAAAPSLYISGDPNTGLYSPGADQVAISTAGTERMRIDNAGNVTIDTNTLYVDAVNNRVGIGTTTPDAALEGVVSNPGSVITVARFRNSGTTASTESRILLSTNTGAGSLVSAGLSCVGLDTAGNTALVFSTAASSALFERARIDSSGRLLVGASSDFGGTILQLSASSSALLAGRTNNDLGTVIRYAASSAGPFTFLGKSRSATLGTNTIVQAEDSLGGFIFSGADGTNFVQSAKIEALIDGTPGADDMPGRLVFATTADGASSPTEHWRLTNDGVIAYSQPDVTSKGAAATLTVAELKTGIIQYTGAAATLTLPTGTLTEGGFSGIYTNMAFEWSVINTGSGLCTIGAGASHTIVGGATIAAGASGRFVSRRTAANTFVAYRLS